MSMGLDEMRHNSTKIFRLKKEGHLWALFSVIIKSRGTNDTAFVKAKRCQIRFSKEAKRKEKTMAKKKQPLTLEALIKEGNGALTPDNSNFSQEECDKETEKENGVLQKCVATKRGRPIKRKNERFKKALDSILSMVISPQTVAEAVKKTPLGDKITYQEAVLIAQVLKAANGDTQAAVFLRDTTGNKLKDGFEEEEKKVIDIEKFFKM